MILESDIPAVVNGQKFQGSNLRNLLRMENGKITPPINGRHLIAADIEINLRADKPVVNENTLASTTGDVLVGRAVPINNENSETARRTLEDDFPSFPTFPKNLKKKDADAEPQPPQVVDEDTSNAVSDVVTGSSELPPATEPHQSISSEEDSDTVPSSFQTLENELQQSKNVAPIGQEEESEDVISSSQQIAAAESEKSISEEPVSEEPVSEEPVSIPNNSEKPPQMMFQTGGAPLGEPVGLPTSPHNFHDLAPPKMVHPSPEEELDSLAEESENIQEKIPAKMEASGFPPTRTDGELLHTEKSFHVLDEQEDMKKIIQTQHQNDEITKSMLFNGPTLSEKLDEGVRYNKIYQEDDADIDPEMREDIQSSSSGGSDYGNFTANAEIRSTEKVTKDNSSAVPSAEVNKIVSEIVDSLTALSAAKDKNNTAVDGASIATLAKVISNETNPISNSSIPDAHNATVIKDELRQPISSNETVTTDVHQKSDTHNATVSEEVHRPTDIHNTTVTDDVHRQLDTNNTTVTEDTHRQPDAYNATVSEEVTMQQLQRTLIENQIPIRQLLQMKYIIKLTVRQNQTLKKMHTKRLTQHQKVWENYTLVGKQHLLNFCRAM